MATSTNPATLRRCSCKVPYRTMRQAEQKAERASGRTGELIIAYECVDCGFFHIGHADLSQHLAREVRIARCRVCGSPIPEHRLRNIKQHETPAAILWHACRKLARKQREAEDTKLFEGATEA